MFPLIYENMLDMYLQSFYFQIQNRKTPQISILAIFILIKVISWYSETKQA